MWRSEGYGYVFEIHGPVLKAFEVTEKTCLPGFTAKREAAAAPGQEAALRMLAHLTPEEWARFGMHAERGRRY